MISVIIPIYKVEEYLDQCVSSVINQTYTDLEVILVDDGSPDQCPKMCDEWATKDSRIKVIHKKNGGLSDARNAGLEVATGEYIAFLDSDDYIEPEMYHTLYDIIKQDDTLGIASCLFYTDTDGKIDIMDKKWDFTNNVIVKGDDFGRNKILQETPHPVWNKLYRADLFQSVRFRVGRVNEDMLFMYDLAKIMKSKQLNEFIIPKYLLYYRIRNNSICRNNESFFQLSIIDNLQLLINESLHDNSGLHDILYLQYKQELYTLVHLLRTDPSNRKYPIRGDIFFDCVQLHQLDIEHLLRVCANQEQQLKEIKDIAIIKPILSICKKIKKLKKHF